MKLRNFSKKPINERAVEYKKMSKLRQNNEEAFKIFVEKQQVYDWVNSETMVRDREYYPVKQILANMNNKNYNNMNNNNYNNNNMNNKGNNLKDLDMIFRGQIYYAKYNNRILTKENVHLHVFEQILRRWHEHEHELQQ